MGKIAFLFSGQGAQYPGMMKDLYENIEECTQIFQIADKVLNRSISNMCFYGSQQELNLTHNTQPCMLAADLAAYMAVKRKLIEPDAIAGFSVGEYAALAAAGVLKMEEVFPLVQLRADYMQEAVPVGEGAMAAIGGMDEADIKDLCDQMEGYVEPANYNCPGQIVVSGEKTAVEQMVSYARSKKMKAMILPVSAPFHCRLMEPAAKRLAKSLESVVLNTPNCPIYMNVDAAPTKIVSGLKEKMIRQVASPVRWEQTLRNMYEDHIDTFVEFGPGKTLSGFVKRTFKGIAGIRILHISDMMTAKEVIEFLMEERRNG